SEHLTNAALASLRQHRDNTELLQHPQLVKLNPGFHDLAATYPHDLNSCDSHLLTSGGYNLKLALVCSVGGEAGHDLVSFGDHVILADPQIGKGAAEHAIKLFEAFTAPAIGNARIVGMQVGREQLIDQGRVPLVPRCIKVPMHEGLVVFC